MPTINLTHRQLTVLSRALQITLDVDENLGLLAATDEAVRHHSLPGKVRRALDDFRENLEAVAQEHQGGTEPDWADLLLQERLIAVADMQRYLKREGVSVKEAYDWCELNAQLIKAVAAL